MWGEVPTTKSPPKGAVRRRGIPPRRRICDNRGYTWLAAATSDLERFYAETHRPAKSSDLPRYLRAIWPPPVRVSHRELGGWAVTCCVTAGICGQHRGVRRSLCARTSRTRHAEALATPTPRALYSMRLRALGISGWSGVPGVRCDAHRVAGRTDLTLDVATEVARYVGYGEASHGIKAATDEPRVAQMEDVETGMTAVPCRSLRNTTYRGCNLSTEAIPTHLSSLIWVYLGTSVAGFESCSTRTGEAS